MLKLFFFLVFTLLLIPTSASADVKVNVDSDYSSNQSSSKTFKNETDIRLESNGEVKEYHGSDGDVHIESSDGKSSVTVNNNGATNNPSPSTSSVTSKTNITVHSNTLDSSPSPSASPSPEATVAGVMTENEPEEEKGLWEYVKKQIAELLQALS